MPKALKGTTVLVLVKKGLQNGFGRGGEGGGGLKTLFPLQFESATQITNYLGFDSVDCIKTKAQS